MYNNPIIRLILLAFCIMLMSSCKDNGTDEITEIDPNNPISASVMEQLLKSININWGSSYDEVKSSMSNYVSVQTGNSEMLQFKYKKGNYSISYLFTSKQLSATSLILPVTNTEIKLDELIKSYKSVGELSNVAIYESNETNTIASVWQYTDVDSAYCAIGFTPIRSDLYSKAPKINVITGDMDVDGFTAHFSGNLEGVDSDTEVGVLYSTNQDVPEESSHKISCVGHDKYEMAVNGLIDESTYYYRAYAIVDDTYYFGEIKSVTTGKAQYSMNGQTFDFVKVEGFPDGDFNIMQTELMLNSDLIIGSSRIPKLDSSGDGHVIKTEFRNYIEFLRKTTGIPFRLPTPEEWVYAAKGGNKSSGYKYCGSDDLNAVAWYSNNSNKSSHAVAKLLPNELNLYDMSGNFSEVCNSTDDIFYIDGKCFGGSWKSAATGCTSDSYINGVVSGNIPNTRLKEKNAFDGTHITVRLVYSRE